jgi:hypothetical protein
MVLKRIWMIKKRMVARFRCFFGYLIGSVAQADRFGYGKTLGSDIKSREELVQG